MYPTGIKRQTLHGVVIHPALGVVIQRKGIIGRQNFRTAIPSSMLRLSTMWSASLGSLWECDVHCFVCREVVDVNSDGGTGHNCSLCLLGAHFVCYTKLLGTEQALNTMFAMVRPTVSYPTNILSTLCPLCSAWLEAPSEVDS